MMIDLEIALEFCTSFIFPIEERVVSRPFKNGIGKETTPK